jgi:hypothetical protein
MRLLETLNPFGENQAYCASPVYDPEWWFDKDTEILAAAICTRCPIINQCLDYAVSEKITDGVYGGLTPAERELLKRGRMKTNGRKAS